MVSYVPLLPHSEDAAREQRAYRQTERKARESTRTLLPQTVGARRNKLENCQKTRSRATTLARGPALLCEGGSRKVVPMCGPRIELCKREVLLRWSGRAGRRAR